MTNYATTNELRAWMGITDSVDDDLLAARLNSASGQVDRDTNRRRGGFSLDTVATARTFNPRYRVVVDSESGEQRLLIDEVGDTTGLIVEVGYGTTYTTVASTDYETGPENAIARGEPITWLLRRYSPWTYGSAGWNFGPTWRIRVTALWGWPAVPDPIKDATLLRAARLHRRRSSPEGVAGFGDLGVVRVSRTDPDYEQLISSFVLEGVG